MIENPDSLWQFVVRLYQLPDVEHKCLYLQQAKSVNVSLLLWACWCWRNSLPLTESNLEDAQQVIAKTHNELVLSLRKLRQSLDSEEAALHFAGAGLHDHVTKDTLRPLRQAILTAEIEGEKLVLRQLHGFTVAEVCLQTQASACDLGRYFEYLGLNKGDADFFERNIVGAILR